jgi:hypothetical protein
VSGFELVAAGLSAAATALSAVGALRQGQAAAATAKYNEAIDAQKAQQARDAAAVQAGQVQRDTTAQIGQQEAAYAAGGVDMSGSPLLVMSDTASQGALKAALTKWQGETQATADLNQSALDSAQGRAAQQGSIIQAGSSLLTGALKAGQLAFPAAPGAGTSPAKPGP